MTNVNPDVLPDLMSLLFRRIRDEMAGHVTQELRMSHVRVMSAVPTEGISVTALAQRVGMTKQGCGQFVTSMSASGHLTTHADTDDRRLRLVTRTPAGDRFMAEVYADLARMEGRFAAQVGERRYRTFARVLAQLGAEGGRPPTVSSS